MKESKLRASFEGYYIHSGQNPLLNNLRTLVDQNYSYSLFKSIEQCKIDLSSAQTVPFLFEKESLSVRDTVTLEEFSAMLHQHIGQIEACMQALFEKASLTFDEIDTVFVTGGSSFVHPIQTLLYRSFPKEKIRIGDAFSSVAYGLALSGVQI